MPNRDFQPVQTPIVVHKLNRTMNNNDTTPITPYKAVLASLTWKTS